MKKSQFEEITMGISIVIMLLAFEFNHFWLGAMFTIKSVFDFLSAVKYAIKEIKDEL